MNDPILQPLPLGNADFVHIRRNNALYVDKTAMLVELAAGDANRIILSRPRRFGKSMLLSTLQSLFEHGTRDFHGLQIEECWKEKSYPVVRLDLSSASRFQNVSEFREKFWRQLRIAFGPAGFKASSKEDTLEDLFCWLQSREKNSLVLLIDEYDAPVTDCLDRPELLGQVRNAMSDFLFALKQHEGALRFLFVTGVATASATGLLSCLNGLKDISFDPAYGTLLGYTQEELVHYFGAHIDRAARRHGLSREALLEKLREFYDGFSFDAEGRTHVCCPWSVLSFFASTNFAFDNYWFQTGGHPNVLLKHLARHGLDAPGAFDQLKPVFLSDLVSAPTCEHWPGEALLAQAVYLTIKASDGAQVLLGCPNKEVYMSMANLHVRQMTKNGASLTDANGMKPADVFSSQPADKVIEFLNRMYNGLNYQHYPIKDEAGACSHLQTLLIGGAWMPEVEKHHAHGRSDLEVTAGRRRWVFEFKCARRSAQTEALLQEAIVQIRSRHYGETPHGLDLIRVAVVFDAQARQITAWRQID